MRAQEHIRAMLQWWRRAGIGRCDLAVRRADGAMLWHLDQLIDELPVAWARAENVRRADIYIRPARGYSWPLVFLDDVPVELARSVAGKYSAVVVETSPAGGCHLWLLCQRALPEADRKLAQRWIAPRLGADPGSVSGEHLGRLAGFKNWKRGGVWVNLAAQRWRLPWNPSVALITQPALPLAARAQLRPTSCADSDTSESARDWGWVCRLLEGGCDANTIFRGLLQRARPRRGSDAERYARRTILRALARR